MILALAGEAWPLGSRPAEVILAIADLGVVVALIGTGVAVMAEVLRQVPYFARLDATLLKELAGQIHQRKYKAGEVILLEREPCEGLYFVISSRVKVFKVSGEGKEQVLRILGPDELLTMFRSSTAD